MAPAAEVRRSASRAPVRRAPGAGPAVSSAMGAFSLSGSQRFSEMPIFSTCCSVMESIRTLRSMHDLFGDNHHRRGSGCFWAPPRSIKVSYVPNPVKRHGIPCPQGLSLPDLQGDSFRCRMPLEARPVPMRLCELPAHSHIRGYRAAAARTSVFRLGGRTAL